MFATDTAIPIEGSASRVPSQTSKHSFKLSFDGDFGSPTKMNYQLFTDSPVDAFDNIELHATDQGSWSSPNGAGAT